MKNLIDTIISEGILDDIEITLATGEDDLKAELYLDTLPTVNNFVKFPKFDKTLHIATWYCPNIVKKYRSKYPDYYIPHDADSISVVLIPGSDRVVNCNLKFSKRDNPPILYITIKGWEDGYVGSNIRKYKKMALDILYKVAKDHNKLNELMDYSYKHKKFWDKTASGTAADKGKYLKIKSFNEL